MRRTVLFLVFAVLTLATLFVSCKKEEYAEPPVYGKVYCRTPNPKAGDTVILAVEVIDPGKWIYHADYTWRCNGLFKQTVKITAPDNSKTIVEEPTFKWVFPNKGNYEVTMSAAVKISMPTASGQIFVPSITSIGKIVIN